MNDRGKSDGLVVPAKPPNNAGVPVAEAVEGRGPAEGNAASKTRAGRRAGNSAPSALGRVRYRAQQDKGTRFTALLHHVTVDRLRVAYRAINPRAASGVDEVTWHAYGQNLEDNLRGLHRRVHCGGYRAKPTRRTYIPKPDGRMRPRGIAAPGGQDRPTSGGARFWNASTRQDFLGFSYGFRPNRSQHRSPGRPGCGHPRERKVNWIIDADIRGFFDNISHEWLMSSWSTGSPIGGCCGFSEEMVHSGFGVSANTASGPPHELDTPRGRCIPLAALCERVPALRAGPAGFMIGGNATRKARSPSSATPTTLL